MRALTHEDVPHNVYTILGLIGVEPEEEFVLAVDRVRYRGEPIVAILAETEAAAHERRRRGPPRPRGAARRVRHGRGAWRPGAPVVTHWGTQHVHLRGRHQAQGPAGRRRGRLRGGRPHPRGRVPHLARSSTRPTETTGCVAVPEANGRFTVYTNTQAIYFSLDNTAIILQVPNNRLRFIGGMVGGGFGGKVDVIVEPLATLGAMLTGRPVRYVYSRTEEMQVSSTRSPEIIRIKDGVMADGTIVARKVTGAAWTAARTAARRRTRVHQVRRQRGRPVPHPQRLDRRVLRLHQPRRRPRRCAASA